MCLAVALRLQLHFRLSHVTPFVISHVTHVTHIVHITMRGVGMFVI